MNMEKIKTIGRLLLQIIILIWFSLKMISSIMGNLYETFNEITNNDIFLAIYCGVMYLLIEMKQLFDK